MHVWRCAHLQQMQIKDFSCATIYLLFWAWVFEENEWIQDEEPFWRNPSLFEDYDFFILHKACRENYMLAIGGQACQCIPDSDIEEDKTLWVQTFKINRGVKNFPLLLRRLGFAVVRGYIFNLFLQHS